MPTRESATAVVAISKNGSALARRLSESLGDDALLYIERRFVFEDEPNVIPFDLPLRPLIGDVFHKHRRLVLFMPVGVAVRLLSPHIKDKHSDPAVLCVDDAGQFVVSLLSGHKGGADDLASEVAKAIGATPVITSASHALNTLAVDMLGKEFGWTIEADPTDVTRASAAVVNGEYVGVWQEAGERLSPTRDNFLMEHVLVCESLAQFTKFPLSAALIITDRIVGVIEKSAFGAIPVVTYRPQSLVVGMGCRKGVPAGELERFLGETMARHELSINSIRCIATSDVKRDEEGLTKLAEKLGVPVNYYSGDELNAHPGPSGPSAAHEHLGVIGVSEPAALLASGSDKLIVPKVKSQNATIAIARRVFDDV